MKGRVPPNSSDAELACLAVGLTDPDSMADLVGVLSPDEFYNQAHKIVFDAMKRIYNKNQPADIVTVSRFLSDTGEISKIGGPAFVAGITDYAVSRRNIEAYVKAVKEKAKARRLIAVAGEISERGYSGLEDIDALLVEAEGEIFKIGHDQGQRQFVSMGDLVGVISEEVGNRILNPGMSTGISTGYIDLDAKTNGLDGGDLIILAARPSMGKTAFALNIIRSVALNEKKPVAMFSLEMSNNMLGERLVCSVAKVNSQKVRSGYMNDDDMRKLVGGLKMLNDAPIYFDDSGDITVLQMRAKARRLKARFPDLALIVVDYLQLMQGKGENRNLELAEISRSLKLMAKDLDVPVLALSQLNRELERRADKRPVMSDLRESGALEQDADLILFLYRDEVYNKAIDNPRRGITEVIIGKQRNGPIGTIELVFQGEHSLFLNKAA